MPTIAGIDNRGVYFFRQQLYRAGIGMSDDQDVWVHSIERHSGVNHSFALFDRTGRNGHIHDVAAEPLAGQLK